MPKRGAERDDAVEIPKLPRSSFLHFINAHRELITAGNPGLSNSEVAKQLGRRWTTLDPGKKRKYSTLASRDTARFNREVLALKEEYGPDLKTLLQAKEGAPKWLDQLSFGRFKYVTKTDKWTYTADCIKDPEAPKQPKAAYLYFSNVMNSKVRADNPDIRSKDVPAIVRERWQALDAAGRRPYEKLAARDQQRYWVEMEAYARALQQQQQQQGGSGGLSSGGDAATAAAMTLPVVNVGGNTGAASRSESGVRTGSAMAAAPVPMTTEQEAFQPAVAVQPAVKVEIKQEAGAVKVELKQEQEEMTAIGVKVEVKEEEELVEAMGVKVEVIEEP